MVQTVSKMAGQLKNIEIQMSVLMKAASASAAEERKRERER